MNPRDFHYGDIIYVDRGPFLHFGVFADINHVIHYCKDETGLCDGTIRETPLSVFLGSSSMDDLYNITFEKVEDSSLLAKVVGAGLSVLFPIGKRVVDFLSSHPGIRYYKGKLYSPEETVYRARQMIGMGEYNLALHNCEHFAIKCKTGVEDSKQVDYFTNILLGRDPDNPIITNYKPVHRQKYGSGKTAREWAAEICGDKDAYK